MAGYTVTVTAEDIRSGFANRDAERCFACPVAMALQRATGDNEARVIESDWRLYLGAWSLWHPAPEPVRALIREFDGLASGDDASYLPSLTFTLPDQADPAWKEECSRCQELRDPAELDRDGVCPECRGG